MGRTSQSWAARARAAWWLAIALLALGVAVAAFFVPWDALVAPWPIGHATSDALHRIAEEYFTPDQRAAISAYVSSVWLPALLAQVAAPLAAVIIALTPLGGRLADACRRRTFVIALVILLLVRCVGLPFEVWTAQVRRDAGLLTQTWLEWSVRWLATTAAICLVGAVLAGLAMAVLRRWPAHGWLAIVAGAALIAAAASLAVPYLDLVEGTSTDAQVSARVMALADRAAVSVGDVRIVDVGDSSPVLNAHVSGWGPTKTVTLYDTLLTTADPAEVDAIVAHELVHVRHSDVVLGTVLAALGAAAAASVAMALLLSPRIRRRVGATSPGDARLVPTLAGVAAAALLLALPIASTVSRPLEARADRQAIATTGDPQGYARMLVLLATTNLSTLEPPDWRYSLFFTHPTPLQRLAIAEAQA